MNALVIGYGNALRGDDGIGPYLARSVAERGWPGVRALAVHQLTPELAEAVAEADVVVFVDARCGDGEPIVATQVAATVSRATGHYSDPGALLALSNELFNRAPVGWFVTVRGALFDHRGEMSAAALAVCPLALDRIATMVQSLRATDGAPTSD